MDEGIRVRTNRRPVDCRVIAMPMKLLATIEQQNGGFILKFSGFDTGLAPLTIERRVHGGEYVVLATLADGDGEFCDDTVITGAMYDYRMSVDEQQEVVVTTPRRKRKTRADFETKDEPPAQQQFVLIDPFGLLDDISDYDPQATIYFPDGQ